MSRPTLFKGYKSCFLNYLSAKFIFNDVHKYFCTWNMEYEANPKSYQHTQLCIFLFFLCTNDITVITQFCHHRAVTSVDLCCQTQSNTIPIYPLWAHFLNLLLDQFQNQTASSEAQITVILDGSRYTTVFNPQQPKTLYYTSCRKKQISIDELRMDA